MQILSSLQADHRPRLVRGDCGFGNKTFIRELEEVGQPYLFKLKRTPGGEVFAEPLVQQRGVD